jgi:DNA-binding Lrp family transcriptional regulator
METATQNKDRVKKATPTFINQKIERDSWQRVAGYVNKSPEEISARIDKLNKEWDIERYLGVNMSTLALSGLVTAAITKNKKWNILPAIVLGFFFQHSVQGWCPPLPLLRLFKIRTSKEIEEEKYALKLLRGDFDAVGHAQSKEVEKIKEAVRQN